MEVHERSEAAALDAAGAQVEAFAAATTDPSAAGARMHLLPRAPSPVARILRPSMHR